MAYFEQGSASDVNDLLGKVRVALEANGYATRQDLRPDGIHLTPDAAAQVAEEWLGPELVAAALG